VPAFEQPASTATRITSSFISDCILTCSLRPEEIDFRQKRR
jgi:hypothetical protein